MIEATIAISATFTAEPISVPLSSWMRALNHPHSIQFAPYGQVLRSLLDPTSNLVIGSGGVNVLLIRLEDWAEGSTNQLTSRGSEFCDALKSFANRSASPILVFFCPDSPQIDSTVAERTALVQQQIIDQLKLQTGVYVVSTQEVVEAYPVTEFFDEITNRTGHIPYSRAFYAGLGTMVARRIDAVHRKPAKVVVVDCDNTLWSGVCGELGPTGVQIEDGHRRLQEELIKLRGQGMLLTLCSKNNEQDVWDVFDQNDAMLLKREDIVAAEINWHPKSDNLNRLAEKLQLSTASFVFLDDNPLEIAEVQANCPSTIAVRIPAEDIAEFLKHVWSFDRLTVTDDDRKRAESYHIETRRRDSRTNFMSLRQFLESLELQVRFGDVDDQIINRISQLTQRTNQFNFTQLRQTPSDIQRIVIDTNSRTFAVDVRDRFGDYGLVGFVQCHRQDHCLTVDSFLLSCRALGRGVEHQMLRHVGKLAANEGFSEVVVRFVPGERNQPAGDFLTTIGKPFESQGDGGLQYRLPVQMIEAIDPLAVDQYDSAANPTPTTVVSSEAEGTYANARLLGQIPHDFRTVQQILDRLSTEVNPRPELDEPYVAPANALENQITAICGEALHLDQVGTNDSLHDLGGTSLQLVQIHSQLVQKLDADLSITELYTLPTVAAIARHISGEVHQQPRVSAVGGNRNATSEGIAVIGLAGRFPGADNVSQFWDNLINGVNSIVEIPEDELNLAPDDPLRQHPNLVRKSAAVNDADKFDARFFGIFPKEAQVMDPQHRLMLEVCWHALEDAGYCPDSVDASVGVFAGCYMNTYILASLASNPTLLASLANSFHGGDLHTELGNDKDYLATRISFLLNLRGPSFTVQTACSTSLVAIIQACQAILSGQCDMALAGGSTLKFPQQRGYLYADGGMVSPDGICRTFDADARGTVFGEGVGAVLLKRVEDAIADGDEIYGVLRGWGINNDGHSKMGYTAPSVDGQSEAIEMAHRHAGISADAISYVEAHGTGTSLGDPIEIDALTRAFRHSTDEKQFCAIGSVKSNIGHLDVAAGVTGLIKTCLALRHEMIPPSLNFNRPNPNIDFENSPFFVATEPRPWPSSTSPRMAGLSSFGVGGTNGHLIIGEPPSTTPTDASREPQLLVLSARSQNALDNMTKELSEFLDQQPEINLSDVAYTLQTGRKTFNYSRVLVAEDVVHAQKLLAEPDTAEVFTRHQVRRSVPVAFMFPGQGAQHVNMARGVYESNPVFRQYFDECCEILKPEIGFDLKDKLFLSETEETAAAINQTTVAQPAIFSVSYALAKSWEHLGIYPDRMIGHSVGEFVAACLAGVFTLPDALRLIAFRARKMQELPPGSMMAVRMTESELSGVISGTDVEIAAINGPTLCVVAGPTESIQSIQAQLESNEVVCRPLHTSHAFHSAMMEPVIEPFVEMIESIKLAEPEIPIISSVTGEILRAEQAMDAMYWARHLRETVRFTDSVERLIVETDCTLLEVGPGQTLSTLARQHPACPKERVILSSSPHAQRSNVSKNHFLQVLGRIWQAGADVDWACLHDEQNRRRVHVPTYPFERQRYWFAESENVVDENGANATTADTTELREPVASVGTAPTEQQEYVATYRDDVTEMVIKQQLHIMRQQLEAWHS